MKVTALDEPTLIRAKHHLDRGESLRKTSQEFRIHRRTLSRAIKLYEEEGPSIFESESVPQRGIRGDRKPPKMEEKYAELAQTLLSHRWDEKIAPLICDNKE